MTQYLSEAFRELIGLRAKALAAKRSGVSPDLLKSLLSRIDIAINTLAQSAAAAKIVLDQSRDSLQSPTIDRVIGREYGTIQRILNATREARVGLADLVMAEHTMTAADKRGEIADIERRFRALTHTARAMEETVDLDSSLDLPETAEAKDSGQVR